MSLFHDDFIFRKKKLLTPEECNKLIEFYKSNYKRVNRNNYYTCVNFNPYTQFFEKKIGLAVRGWRDKYPYLFNMIYTWQLDDYSNIQKYNPGQYYSGLHCEHSPRQQSLRRIGAWMIYLNTIKKGGGTEFPSQKKVIKPIQGDCYIWPAGWTHPHRGVPAPEEEKYIITGWISYTDIN